MECISLNSHLFRKKKVAQPVIVAGLKVLITFSLFVLDILALEILIYRIFFKLTAQNNYYLEKKLHQLMRMRLHN